jgi:hypothetical protein
LQIDSFSLSGSLFLVLKDFVFKWQEYKKGKQGSRRKKGKQGSRGKKAKEKGR